MSPEQLADRLGAVADQVAAVDRTLPALAAPPGAFGADGAGVPGRVGRALHEHWQAVVAARVGEAADAAARLRDMADRVRATGRDYQLTDETAARRVERSAPFAADPGAAR